MHNLSYFIVGFLFGCHISYITFHKTNNKFQIDVNINNINEEELNPLPINEIINEISKTPPNTPRCITTGEISKIKDYFA